MFVMATYQGISSDYLQRMNKMGLGCLDAIVVGVIFEYRIFFINGNSALDGWISVLCS